KDFCKKLWNVLRFIEFKYSENNNWENQQNGFFGRWIWKELEEKLDISKGIKNYEFRQVLMTIQHFLKTTFCNEYLEFVKNDIMTDNNWGTILEIYRRIIIL